MFENTWNTIVDWFRDRNERTKLLREFNTSAKVAFVSGAVPTLLKASVSKGEAKYRHQFSNWLNTGFRIQAFSGKQLSKEELVEIHGDVGNYGLRFQLKDYVALSE